MTNQASLDLLRSPELFGTLPTEYPVDVETLKDFLLARLQGGDGEAAMKLVAKGGLRHSTKLLDVVAQSIQNTHEFDLLEEQLEVFNTIVSHVENPELSGDKSVIIVRGGPGTGKSVLAIQLLSYGACHHWRVSHATGSKAFKTVLQALTQSSADELLKRIYNARYKNQLPIKELFTQFSTIGGIGSTEGEQFDLVVHDEAHRLWDFRRGYLQKQLSDVPLIEEVIAASRTSAFFLDDNQAVRANEIGSVEYIRDVACQVGAQVTVMDLNLQFRCAGSSDYINWVDYVYQYSDTRSLAWKQYEGYNFEIVDTMEDRQVKLDALHSDNQKCRMVAGFCWKWSKPKGNGELVHDLKHERF